MIVRSDASEIYLPQHCEDLASSGFWSPLRRWYLPCKGVADCLVGLSLLLLVSPILLLAALLVKLTSPGPAFYRQTRIGKKGRPFSIFKLRTMHDNCESASGPLWSTPGDSRITPLGLILRRTHLDELPQLWNVVRGDMALVGPRPERPEFIPNLAQALSHYADRLLVRPGMTGLAQVQLPPDTDLASVRRKLAYDLYYVRYVSLGFDLRILMSTLGICSVYHYICCPSSGWCRAGTSLRKLTEPQPAKLSLWPRYSTQGRIDTPSLTDRRPSMLDPTQLQKAIGDVNLHFPGMERPRRNLLYVVHRVPYPLDKGDRIRAFHLLRYLARQANVYVACLADEPISAETLAVLRRYCHRLEVVPLGPARWMRAMVSLLRGRTVSEGVFQAPALAATIRDWTLTANFDASIASSSAVSPYLRLPELQDVPAIVDLVDVDSQKWLDYASADGGWRSWLYRTEGRRLRALEQPMPEWAHAVTLVSEAEANLYRCYCSSGHVRAIVNGVDLDYFQPRPTAEEPACVFVGALDYRPNVDAVRWFAETIWPSVHSRNTGSKLWLVGRRPAAAVRDLAACPGVEVVGSVADVRPWMARAAVVIAPLRIARGLQNKVLEALAMAKAVIASPPALAALHLRPGKHCLRAASDAAWIKGVTRLIRNERLRESLGLAGRRYVEEHHHWDRCLEPLGELLDLPVRPDSQRSYQKDWGLQRVDPV